MGLSIAAWGRAPRPWAGTDERPSCTFWTIKQCQAGVYTAFCSLSWEELRKPLQLPWVQAGAGLAENHPRFVQSTRQEKKRQKLLGGDCPEDKPQLCQSYPNPEKGRKCNR